MRLKLFACEIALAVAAALCLAGPGSAAGLDTDQRVAVTVKASDADLHTRVGAQALALRIRNAAARACGLDDYPVAVRFSDGFIHCRETAIDRAIQGLNSPLLADALGRSPQVLARGAR